MESSEQTGAYISSPICTNRLIFSKGAFFIFSFLKLNRGLERFQYSNWSIHLFCKINTSVSYLIEQIARFDFLQDPFFNFLTPLLFVSENRCEITVLCKNYRRNLLRLSLSISRYRVHKLHDIRGEIPQDALVRHPGWIWWNKKRNRMGLLRRSVNPVCHCLERDIWFKIQCQQKSISLPLHNQLRTCTVPRCSDYTRPGVVGQSFHQLTVYNLELGIFTALLIVGS